jgi:hypothetical protein
MSPLFSSCARLRGSGDRVGIPKPRECGSVIGADRRRSGPSCVLPKGVSQGQTESGGIVLAAICWAASARRWCHPKEALYLPTFSHLLIVNKLLSLSLSLTGKVTVNRVNLTHPVKVLHTGSPHGRKLNNLNRLNRRTSDPHPSNK